MEENSSEDTKIVLRLKSQKPLGFTKNLFSYSPPFWQQYPWYAQLIVLRSSKMSAPAHYSHHFLGAENI